MRRVPRQRVRLISAAAAVVLASAVATVATRADAIIGDAPVVAAESNPYAFVGRSATLLDDGKHRMCTVELIDPQIAITARHCTLDNGFLARTEIVFGGVHTEGDDHLPAGPRQTVAEVHRNEDADVALLRLTGAVDGITPISLPSPEFANAVQRGSAVSVVGWGNVDTAGTGTTELRRAAHVVQARYDNGTYSRLTSDWPVPAFATIPGYYRPGDGDFVGTGQYAISGDSGGPLISYDGASPVLVGVFTTFFPKNVGPIEGQVTQNYFTNIGATGKYGLNSWMNRHLGELRS